MLIIEAECPSKLNKPFFQSEWRNHGQEKDEEGEKTQVAWINRVVGSILAPLRKSSKKSAKEDSFGYEIFHLRELILSDLYGNKFFNAF